MTRTKCNDTTDKKPTGLLALFAGDLAHSDTIPLSALQVDIILKSLYKEGTDADPDQYSDDELLTCTDAERAYKRPLFSIRRAGAMMAEQKTLMYFSSFGNRTHRKPMRIPTPAARE